MRVVFWATVLFAAATFWLVPRPPMADLPQHAGQVALLRDLLRGGSKWQPLLYIDWFTPYFAGGPALLLSYAMPVLQALKLLLALAYLGFVAACVALRRTLGGDERLDWLFVPSFFGVVYATGLYPFLVAAPIAVLFILTALCHARAPTLATGVILLLTNIVLFFAHGLAFLFANAIGGLFLLLNVRSLPRLALAALPYVAMGVLGVAYHLARVRGAEVPVTGPWSFSWGFDDLRLSLPYLWAGWSTDDTRNGLFAVLFALQLAAPLLLGARLNRIEALVPLLVAVLVWIAVPSRAQGTSLLYLRFALFILPFYALIFVPRDAATSRWSPLVLPLVCWVFLAVHVDRLRAFAAESAPFEEVLAAASPADRALAVVFDARSAAAGSEFAYSHWPSWYQTERGGLVDLNFARFLPQIVRYRSGKVPARFSTEDWAQNPAGGFNWERDGASAYRYFFVRHKGPLPRFFPEGRCQPVLVRSSGDWSLYENVACWILAP
ncbi:hypothetical protein [Reyranella sp.]|uniref:hypothetical protein n=1 Tax=Reyranella sp. TaxID=1929291 RepID=UPI0025CBFC3B|nr:hypothetical protein [Reyranella sp.]